MKWLLLGIMYLALTVAVATHILSTTQGVGSAFLATLMIVATDDWHTPEARA